MGHDKNAPGALDVQNGCVTLEGLHQELTRMILYHLGLDGVSVTEQQAKNLAAQQTIAVVSLLTGLGLHSGTGSSA